MFLVVMTTLWWSIGFKATEIAKVSTSRLSVMRSKWCCMDRSDLSLDGRSDHIWLQRCPTAQIRQSNPSDREDSQPGRVRVRDSNELRIPALTALTTFAHYLCVRVVTKIGENSSITCISFTRYTSYPWRIRAGPLTKWVSNDSALQWAKNMFELSKSAFMEPDHQANSIQTYFAFSKCGKQFYVTFW